MRLQLCLTFDDGPDERWTPRVLDALARERARATFFLVGELAQRARAVVSQTLAAGHAVQLHCHRHVRHSGLSEGEIDSDTRTALSVLGDAGARPRLWRTPWGDVTPATRRVAARHGLELVGWTLDTHDWRGDSPPRMLAEIGEPMRRRRGGIVLMHDGLGPGSRRSGAANTVALVGPLIAAAREAGLQAGALREDAWRHGRADRSGRSAGCLAAGAPVAAP